jgi:ParB-like chromosome segregation protein Spo0J
MPPTAAAVALLSVVPTPTDSDGLPEPTPEQYQALKEDIRQRGVQVAIEVCAKSGEILDGRVRVRICEELRIRHYPRRVVAGLDTEEARRHHRLRVNLLRRQLDRAAIKALVLAEMRRRPRSDRFLASIFGVSHPTIGVWRREFSITGSYGRVLEKLALL